MESSEQPRHAAPANPVHVEEHAHPGPRAYVKIAVFLAIVTALEVAIYYLPAVRSGGAFVPLLLLFSGIKFGMVALYFMHLKFDSRLFRRLFVMGIILAMAVYAIVLGMFLLNAQIVVLAVVFGGVLAFLSRFVR